MFVELTSTIRANRDTKRFCPKERLYQLLKNNFSVLLEKSPQNEKEYKERVRRVTSYRVREGDLSELRPNDTTIRLNVTGVMPREDFQKIANRSWPIGSRSVPEPFSHSRISDMIAKKHILDFDRSVVSCRNLFK